MKKWLVGSLVGAIIVFAWQTLSWTMLGIHDAEATYSASQDKIMTALGEANLEDGVYFLPNVPPGSDMDTHEEMRKSMVGKPWARILYKRAYKDDMTMSMIRGFLVNLFLVFSFIYIITRGGTPPAIRVFAGSVDIGLFGFLWGLYIDHVWFQTPAKVLHGHIIDALVAWGLCGLWLGWWMNRKK